MFGRHKHRDEVLRTELAEDARKALADVMRSAESGHWAFLERSEQLQLPAEAWSESLRNSVADQEVDLVGAVDHNTRVHALLVERVEDDRLERRALVEAIERLATPSTTSIDAQPTATRPRVIGDTLLASPDTLHDNEISLIERETDVSEPDPATVGTEVWERFEKLRGERVQVDEFVATRLDRGTRLTRRGSSR